MLPFRKILFPVDYSDPCTAALPYVKELVQHFNAQLSLVHAYGSEALALTDLALIDPALPAAAATAEHERLHKFAAEKFPAIHAETFVGLGEAGEIIHAQISHQQADLVMLPTHGRGPVRKMLLGSVAAKVLHDATAAVWTATPDALSDARGPYKSILCACALDETEDVVVLKAAAWIARSYNARLSILHIVNVVPISGAIDYVALQDSLRDAANIRLRELKAELGIDAPHRIAEGPVASSVRREAERVQADLIITGRGLELGAISRFWSNLYPIVRESPCPVLSF